MAPTISDGPAALRDVISPALQRLRDKSVVSPERIAEIESQRLERAEKLAEASRRSQWSEITRLIGPRYETCELSNFTTYGTKAEQAAQGEALKHCQSFAQSIGSEIRNGNGLLLYGPPGTGKDHLMVALMRVAFAQGATIKWVNGIDFFGDVRDRIDAERPEEQLLRDLSAPDILAISDPVPPWGPLTAFQAAMLFRLIDRRYRRYKPIWATLNISGATEAVDRIGAAAIDRLRDKALSIHCNWGSYRHKGAQA